MGRLLTEYEVRTIGGSGASYTTNLLCTWARAQAFNCVANGASFSSNQLVWEGSVRRAGSSPPTDYCQTCTPSCSWSLSYSTDPISCSGGTRTITATPSGSCTRYYAYSGASCGTTYCSGTTSTTVNATCADHSGTYQGVSYSFPTPQSISTYVSYPHVSVTAYATNTSGPTVTLSVYGPSERRGINCCGEACCYFADIGNGQMTFKIAFEGQPTSQYVTRTIYYSGGTNWGLMTFSGLNAFSGKEMYWNFEGGGGVDLNGNTLPTFICDSGCSGSIIVPY